MAKVSYIDPNLADIKNLYSVVRVADRFSISRVVKKNVFLSPQRIQELKDRSYLKDISTLWKSLTNEQRAAWKAVDPRSRKNGWQLFVKDMSLRFKANLEGMATPNIYHQASVGMIKMFEGAGEYKITQQHPNTYYLQRRIAGKKGMLESVEVKEQFYLPLKIGLSFLVEGEPDGPDPQAYFGVKILSHYQGRDIETIEKIALIPDTEWNREEITITTVLGEARSYELSFYLKDVKGNLYFDNILAEHNGQNWARDWQCDNIEAQFTRVWQQIAQNWLLEIDSPNAFHASGYIDY
jgi:hypothetical protein